MFGRLDLRANINQSCITCFGSVLPLYGLVSSAMIRPPLSYLIVPRLQNKLSLKLCSQFFCSSFCSHFPLIRQRNFFHAGKRIDLYICNRVVINPELKRVVINPERIDLYICNELFINPGTNLIFYFCKTHLPLTLPRNFKALPLQRISSTLQTNWSVLSLQRFPSTQQIGSLMKSVV
jgi:hypothetical protein